MLIRRIVLGLALGPSLDHTQRQILLQHRRMQKLCFDGGRRSSLELIKIAVPFKMREGCFGIRRDSLLLLHRIRLLIHLDSFDSG